VISIGSNVNGARDRIVGARVRNRTRMNGDEPGDSVRDYAARARNSAFPIDGHCSTDQVPSAIGRITALSALVARRRRIRSARGDLHRVGLCPTCWNMVPPSELSRLATLLGGVPISGCLEGSPAARAGLRYGDVVLAINGVPTASWADFFQARRRATDPVLARIFRQGREFDVRLELPAQTRTPRQVLEQTVAV
jgi:hypothetical protein